MGDYFTPGNPVEGWGVNWNTNTTKANFPIASAGARYQIPQTSMTNTSTAQTKSVAWTGTATNGTSESLFISQSLKLDTGSTYFTVTVFVKNVGTTSLSDVVYFRSVDPDNEQPLTGTYATKNRILKQAGYGGNSDTSIVVARGNSHNVPIYLGAVDSRARVSRIGFINFAPANIINNAGAPESTYYYADRSINIAFEIGDLDTGQCALFTYFYALSDNDINDIVLPVVNDFSFSPPDPNTGNLDLNKTSCGDSTVKFYDYSTGSGVSYIDVIEWFFDEDTIADAYGDSAVHTFSNWGTYTIRKRVSLCSGDVYDTTITVKVLPGVEADFYLSDSAFCENIDSITIVNRSSTVAGSLDFIWKIYGDSVSNATDLQYDFVKDTTYDIHLTATNDSGCMDTFSLNEYISIRPTPTASFYTTDSIQCFDQNYFPIYNNSSITSGSITYKWFNDTGQVGTGSYLSPVVYSDTGLYLLKLEATSNMGCVDSLSSLYQVLPSPLANFGVVSDRQCLENNVFNFRDSSIGNSTVASFRWEFGSGDTSVLANPDYSFPRADTFNTILVVENNYGCFDTLVKSVIVDSMPTALFDINDTFQCGNDQSFSFTNQSYTEYGGLTYQWNLGDGSTDTGLHISGHNYASEDSFTVSLVVTNENNCSDSITSTVVVLPVPHVDFEISLDSQCYRNHAYEVVNETDIKYGDLQFNWKYNGQNKLQDNDTLTGFPTHGNYTVWLVALSDSGCTDSLSKNIFIRSQPEAAFSILDSQQCLSNNSFDFINQSTNVTDSFHSHVWSFSDGSTHTSEDVTSKAFSTYDTFDVQLISTTVGGCADTLIRKVIVDPMPSAGFDINDDIQCLNENQFELTSTSSIPYGSYAHEWKFGDGQIRNSGAQDSVHYAYSAYDTLTLWLYLESNEGCRDSISHDVVVHPNPSISTNLPKSYMCFSNNSFDFYGTVSLPYGSFTTHWDFGDGSSSNQEDVENKSYDTWGFFDVWFKVTSDQGCADSIYNQTGVAPKPNAQFTITTDTGQCLSLNSFSFRNESTVDSGWLTDFAWNFKDETAIDSSANITNKVFNYPDTFSVRHTIISNEGCKDSIDKTVIVYPQASLAFDINDSLQCFNTNSFDFTNQSDILYGTLNFKWHLGDGDSTTTKDVSNKVYTLDTFQILLTSVSDHGCRDSLTKPIEIYPNPKAEFYFNDSVQCFIGHSVDLTNQSTISDGNHSFEWKLEDGSSFETTHVTNKVFSTADTFDIKLVATSDLLCKDSITRPVIIHPNPVVLYDINDDRQCQNVNEFVFTNRSNLKSGTMTALWEFGDGNNSASFDSSNHVYHRSDTFWVTLTMTSDQQCSDEFIQKVVVDSVPVVNFQINDSTQCFSGNAFDFLNLSQSHEGSMLFHWSLGDGNSSSDSNVIGHQYLSPDSMDVMLRATNMHGCKDSLLIPLIVFPQPEAYFDINDDRQCFAHHGFNFNNTSIANVGMLSYDWQFGDGNTSTLKDITSLKYSNPDSFVVALFVTNSESCVDSLKKQVIVDPEPTVDFILDDDRQCFTGHQFNAQNQSVANVGANAYIWNLGDGRQSSSIHQNNVVFDEADTFDIQLIATNSQNCVDSLTKTVIVDDQPVARFALDTTEQCLFANEFNATNQSTTEFDTMAYEWLLSDGSKFTSTDLIASFSNFSGYTIKLVVTNVPGCKDSISEDVIVHPMPVPVFNVPVDEQCFRGNAFDYINVSSIPSGSLTYRWELGDGESSTSKDIVGKHYDTALLYNLKLIATSDKMCVDSITNRVIVHPNPITRFDINKIQQCLLVNSYNFENQTTIVSDWNLYHDWDLGDGTTSTATSIVDKVYALDGEYEVTLKSASDFGCADTMSREIIVVPSPLASFVILEDEQCLNENAFEMINQSTVNIGSLNYYWDFNDNTTSNAKDIQAKSYLKDSEYTVRLIVEDTFNCRDTAYNGLTVHPHPVSVIDVDPTCENDTVLFTSLSHIKNTSIQSHQWEFGDGSSSTVMHPTKMYAQDGQYQVRLTTTSDKGCAHDTTVTAVIWPKPEAHFKWTRAMSYIDYFEYQFTDLSDGPVKDWNWLFGDGQVNSNQDPYVVFYDTGTYQTQLIVTDTNNCVDTTILGPAFFGPEFIIHIPNSFTPNGDNINDTYHIVISKYLKEFDFKLYNRWGEQIFHGDMKNTDWDGTYKGSPVMDGNYIYTLKVQDIYNDIHYFKGYITVLH